MKKFISQFKEEIVAIPLLFLAFALFRKFIFNTSPETAIFDMFSEMETFAWNVIKLFLSLVIAWLGLRIAAPKLYASLCRYYFDMTKEPSDKLKQMALRAFLVIFFALIYLVGSSQNYKVEVQTPTTDTVIYANEVEPFENTNCVLIDRAFSICGNICITPLTNNESLLRNGLIKALHAQLNVREATNTNDGVMVERYLKSVNLGKGYAWCAAFTTYNLNYFSIPNPQSAWSPDWAKTKDRVWQQKAKNNQTIQPGDCFTIYYANKGRVGHVGFVTADNGSYITTIEGNTNNNGSRLGIGVFALKRQKSKIYAVTNYITPYITTKNEKPYLSIYCGDNPVTCQLPLPKDSNNHRNQSNTNRYGYDSGNGTRYLNTVSSRHSLFASTFAGRFQWNKGCKQNAKQWASNGKSASYQWAVNSHSLVRQFGSSNNTARQHNKTLTESGFRNQKNRNNRAQVCASNFQMGNGWHGAAFTNCYNFNNTQNS